MTETKPLVVVESPTKVRTLKNYLGQDYRIAATVGHIRDLPVKEIGIDIADGFKPKYRTIPGKQKIISALKKAADDADAIGVVVFELNGNTYLVESNDTFDNNTANVSIVTVIELEGLTGVTAVADAAAANTVLIA